MGVSAASVEDRAIAIAVVVEDKAAAIAVVAPATAEAAEGAMVAIVIVA
jgi:hypothetical protein